MRYTATQYAKVLHDLAEETPATKTRAMIRDFLSMLASQNALSLIPDIKREYQELEDKERGVRKVSVRTPERESELGMKRKLPFKADVVVNKDVRLGGGAVIETGDIKIDNSVRMRMERLRKALVG